MAISVGQSPTVNTTAIDPEATLASRLCAIFRWATRPLVSLYCALKNKALTGYWLTTTQVLPEIELCQFYRVEGGDQSTLAGYKQAITRLKSNSQVAFHLGCQNSIVPHSTALVVGKDAQGKLYALFFNANGASPAASSLGQKDFKIDSEQSSTKHLETAQEFYEAMMEGVESPPALLYSSADIQADRVSCTAYTAIFLDECKAAAKKEEFDPKTFMQNVANGNVVTHEKARAKVSETAKKIAARPSNTPYFPSGIRNDRNDRVDSFLSL